MRSISRHLVRTVWLAGILMSVALNPGWAEPTRCALLSARDAGELAHATRDLVGTLFNAHPEVALVERADVQHVLDEWFLANAAMTSPQARRALAGVLGADLLVFFSEEQGDEGTAISARVVDAATGLQIASEVTQWRVKRPEKTAEVFFDAILRAQALTSEPFAFICAVPPFECLDVSFEAAGLGAPLSIAAGRALLARGRVAVAELAEVDALVQETLLQRDTSVQRVLPHYFLGQYRTRRDDAGRQISITLKVRHGASLLATNESGWMAEAAAKDWLSTTVQSLLPDAAAPPSEESLAEQARVEAGLLSSRGMVFKSIGEYDLAAAMLKSAVLLDPGNIGAHFNLAHLYGTLVRNRRSLATEAEAIRTQEQRVTYYLRPFNDSLSVVLRGKMPIPKVRREMWVNRSDTYLSGYDFARDPQRIRHDYARELLRQADLYRQVLEDPALRPTDPRHLSPLRECLARNLDKVQSIDPEAVWPRWVWLLKEQYDHQIPFSEYFPHLYNLIDPRKDYARLSPDDRAVQQLARLEPVLPALARFIGDARLLVNSVTNRTSHTAAWAALRELKAGYPLVESDYSYLQFILDVRLDYVLGEDKPRLKPGKPIELSLLPEFSRLPQRTVVHWVVADGRGDYVAASDGLWFVSPGGTWSQLSAQRYAKLAWDGEGLWAVHARGLVRLNAEGHESALAPAEQFPSYTNATLHLVAYGPGRLCVVSELFRDKDQRRMWAARVSSLGEVDLFYEERVLDRAAGIKFVQPTTWGARSNHPCIWVGFDATRRVLSLDPENGGHSYLNMRFPFARFVQPWKNQLLVMEGMGPLFRSWNGYRIYSVQGEADPVEVFADLSPWLFPVYTGSIDSYFYTGVEANGYLHLLMRSYGRPAWTVLDLERRKPRMGMLQLPFRTWTSVQLVNSPHYGLLALGQGKAYRVNLPPFEELAPMPEYGPVEPGGS